MDLQVVALYPHDLAARIAHALKKPLITPHIHELPDSEVMLRFDSSCRWKDSVVVLIESTSVPIHDSLIKIALLADHIKQAGARKIIGVIPYLGYVRQFHNDLLTVQRPVHVIVQLLESSAIDEYVLVEPHDKKITMLFSKPVIDVDITDVLVHHIKTHMAFTNDFCIVAPDKGAFARAQTVAQQFGCPVMVYHKERISPEEVRIVNAHGEYNGANALIIDDIFNTGSTAFQVSNDLFARGIHNITGYFIHPVFSSDAYARAEKSFFKQIFVSNSLTLAQYSSEKIKVFDISDAVLKALASLLRK